MKLSLSLGMIQLQEKFNQRIDPNWRERNFDFGRAIFVESAELAEHIGWKWWKHQTSNVEQARLELVDIWHFGMSMVMQVADNHEEAAQIITQQWSVPSSAILVARGIDQEPHVVADMPLLDLVEVMAAGATMRNTFLIPMFHELCNRLHMTPELLHKLYISKNALNDFRQANGYKQGTYLKVWYGQEDNEVLMDIVDQMPDVTYETVTKALEAAYKQVAP